jgi:hypothetical protein
MDWRGCSMLLGNIKISQMKFYKELVTVNGEGTSAEGVSF